VTGTPADAVYPTKKPEVGRIDTRPLGYPPDTRQADEVERRTSVLSR
jgi:hypothetical protein